MANYVAHHTKKKERLQWLELQLSRSVREGAPFERQLVLANEVRLARIRALRATQATFPPKAVSQTNQGVSLEVKIAALEKLTADELLGEFVSSERR